MVEERIIVYRFGDVGSYDSKNVFDAHFNHLKDNGKMLFTTSSRLALKNFPENQEIVFLDRSKDRCFKGVVVKRGKFGIGDAPDSNYTVPQEFEDILEDEKEKQYRWLAIDAIENDLQHEVFGKNQFRLLSKVEDVVDSMGKNQNPIRIVIRY